MLIRSTEVICFVAQDAMMEEHFFHCYKVIISFKGTYTATLNGTTLHHVSGHVLNSNVSHLCQAPGTSTLIYLIEIESRLGHAVRQLLREQPYLDLSMILATAEFTKLLAEGQRAVEEKNLSNFANQVILTLLPTLGHQPVPELDHRIYKTLHFIETHIQEPFALKEVAEQINLSVGRTRHLFEQEIGAPFSQFVLWKRVKSVVYAVLKDNMNLDEAVYQYGFFDRTHFGRNFKRMFGDKPSNFLKNNPNVQLI